MEEKTDVKCSHKYTHIFLFIFLSNLNGYVVLSSTFQGHGAYLNNIYF